MRKDANGNPSPETFIEAWTMAKQKANKARQPVSYAGFYVNPDNKHKEESWLSRIIWVVIFLSSCFWGPPLLTWLFGNP